MKLFGKPGNGKDKSSAPTQATSAPAPVTAPSNAQALETSGLDKDKKGGWLSRAWSSVKGGAKEAGDGAKQGAVLGALASTPLMAVTGGVGALVGGLGGGLMGGVGGLFKGGLSGAMDGAKSGAKSGAMTGGKIGAGVGALPGALIGGLAGLATRGVDELRTDEKELLEQTASIPGYHIILEQLAHKYAYGKGDLGTLDAWGYELVAEHEDAHSGFRVVGFKPKDASATDPDGKPLNPVVAFRGTANAGGALDDANDQGIGTFQFSRNEKETSLLLQQTGPGADVTGHSLGGALAQLAAARFGSMVRNIVTFQSPGINGAEAQRIDNKKHKATHYRTGGDLVSDAGEAFAVGEVFTFDHKGPNSPLSHMTFPLAELNALRAKHNMDKPIVSGARSNDTWIQDGEGHHNGHWAEEQAQTESRLMKVRHADDAQEADTTTLTSLVGKPMKNGGRGLAEGVRKMAGDMTGIADRQSGYAAAWRDIRGVVSTVKSADEVSPARKQVVDLCIQHKVDPKDFGKFISQAEAAMLDALEASPMNASSKPLMA